MLPQHSDCLKNMRPWSPPFFLLYPNSDTTGLQQSVTGVSSRCHMLLWCLFVSQIEEQDAGESTDQEDHIKPTVIEVEL